MSAPSAISSSGRPPAPAICDVGVRGCLPARPDIYWSKCGTGHILVKCGTGHTLVKMRYWSYNGQNAVLVKYPTVVECPRMVNCSASNGQKNYQ